MLALCIQIARKLHHVYSPDMPSLQLLEGKLKCLLVRIQVHVPNFAGLSGPADSGGADNSIQFINFGRVGDKSFKEWRQKIGGWKGG